MHEGNEVGRKDDCESWIYMIIDLIDQERLPWHNVEDKRRLRKLKAEALKAPRSLFKREEVLLLKYMAFLKKFFKNYYRRMICEE